MTKSHSTNDTKEKRVIDIGCCNPIRAIQVFALSLVAPEDREEVGDLEGHDEGVNPACQDVSHMGRFVCENASLEIWKRGVLQ